MKRFLAILMSVLTVCFCTACTSESMKDANNTEIYRENVVDFTLYIPESWVLDATSFVVSAHCSADDPSTVMMTQVDLTSGLNEIPTIFENTKTELATIYTFHTLAEAYERKVAGLDAAVYQYSLTDETNGTILNYLQCMFIRQATLYTFTYYAAPALYETHMDEVNKMLDAVTFDKKDPPAGMVAAVSAGSRDVDCSDFTIQIPEDWLVDTSTGVFTAMASGSDVSNLSVMRANVSEGTTPVDYYEANKTALQEELSDFTVVELKKDFITKDSTGKSFQAVTVEYTATVSEQAYHFKQLFCCNGTTMYLVTVSAPEALYQTHTEAVDNALASFTLVTK